MLCPKCGYISFDNLTSCAKCQHDLSEIQSQLNGTAIQVEQQYFLNSACPPDDNSEDSIDSTETIDTSMSPPPEDAEPDDAKPDELAVDLEDMPPIDLSEIDPETETIELAEAEEPELTLPTDESPLSTPIPDEEEDANVNLVLENEQTPASDHEIPLDTESLTLDTSDDELYLHQEEEIESTNVKDEGIPISLEQIDLSDLVHSPEKGQAVISEDSHDGAEEQANEPEDLLDLSLPSDSIDDSTIDFSSQDLTLESDNSDNSPNGIELVLDTDDTDSAADTLEAIDLTVEPEIDNTEEISLSLDDILEETDNEEEANAEESPDESIELVLEKEE